LTILLFRQNIFSFVKMIKPFYGFYLAWSLLRKLLSENA
jgi:hypothetical protein